MAAIILYLATTMAALEYRSANSMKCIWFALRVIEKTVMGRMKAAWNWQTGGYFDSNPMAEFHTKARKKRAKKHIPLWEVIEKERATWSQCPNTLCYPLLTPIQVSFFRERVIGAISIFFSEVEWRIGKDCVNYAVFDPRKNDHAVIGVKSAETGGICRIDPGSSFEKRTRIKR